MRYFIKLELTYFVERELSLIVNSLSYRFRLIALEKPLSVGELIDKLTEVTTDVSDSAMVSGNSFLRVRIAYEYPNRGSGMVKITGNMPNAGVPVSIGNLDKMYTPVCGLIDGEWIGRYTKEEMHFCFSEVPQTVKNVLNAPRVFLLAATSEATWVSTPVKQSWPSIFGMLVLIACIIILLSFLIFIPSMLAAKAKGFPIYRDSECIWFGEPVPVKTFTQEYFIPRRHRLVWVFLSIIALSVIYVYYGTTINNLMTVLQDSGAVSAPYKNQKDILTDLTVDAVTSAMSYLIFPLPDVTLGELLVYRDGAGAKTLPYVFIGDAALSSFQNSMQVIYNNLTGTNGILNDILSVADTGYGSYASLFAVRYETMFIAVQQSVMSGLQRMETFVEQNLGSVATTEYAVLVEFEFQILQLRELLRKLYILDHIVISSYADVAGVNEASWPWPDDTDLSVLVSKASAAAQDLRNQVNTATTALNSIISSLNSAFEQSLSYTFGDTTDMYSMSYAMGSLTSTIWGLQASRCNDAKLAGNHTVDDIASAQKEQELACIAAQESLLSEIITSEGSIRKSSQMRIYLSQSEPLNNLMTAVGWQRKENLQNGLEQSIVVFVCTLVGFSAVAVMMVTHFRLLEYKTQMTQPPRMTAKDATKHRPRRASSATSPSPSGAALSGKEVYEGQMEEKDQPSSEPSLVGKHSAASPREGKIDYGVAKIVSPLKFGDDDVHKAREGREQADGVPLSDDGEEEYDSTNVRRERQPRGHASPPPASHWRRRGWVIVPLLGFLLISLVPLCCSFWLYQLAHTVVSDTLFQIDIILSLYSKVESLVNTLDQLLEVTAKHYLGVINEETYEAFMNSLEAQISQLNYAFLWDMFVDSSVYVTNVETTYQKVLSILADEIDSFDNAVGSGDTLDYFTPQSWYGRTILPTLSSDNTYGALLPPGVTTGGSDVNTFATDLYNTAKTNIPAAASSAEFTSLFTAYAAACTALDHISDAELQMWHAVVAATRTNGAPVAVQYSTFKNLVSESSLSGITSSSEASAPAAKAEVEDYFAALLSASATTEDITALFTESDTEPATSTPPVSADAYTMAGYVTTLMNTMVSETKFANVYAYNRNLTQNSANLKGQKTLVEAIEDLKDAVEGLLSAVGTEGEIVIKPATMNEWIWYSEVSFRKATLRDHEDLTYLGDAVRWTVIISFWGLLIPIYFLVYAAYLRSGAL